MKLINRTFKPLVTRLNETEQIKSVPRLHSFTYATSSLDVSLYWSAKLDHVPANPWMNPGSSTECLSYETGYLLLNKLNAGIVKILCANDLRLPFQVRTISFTGCSQLVGFQRNYSQSTAGKAVSTNKSV